MYRLSFRVMPAMDYRPNSKPEYIWPSSLQRATVIFYEPRPLYFIKKVSRLQKYADWPHGM